MTMNNFGILLQAKMDPSKDALLSDICIATASAPTYFPAYAFHTKDSEGTDREFHLVDGGIAANNPVRNHSIDVSLAISKFVVF